MSNYEEFRKLLNASPVDVVSKMRLEEASEFNELHAGGVDARVLGRVIILTGLAVMDCLRRLH